MLPPSSPRVFAIVPAAGRSRRMGQPKLLLPWGDDTIIGHLLKTLQAAEIVSTWVLVRPDDAALRAEVEQSGGVSVQPDDSPEEMRDSVELLLQSVGERAKPGDEDGWLLIPGDHPLMRPATLTRLLDAWRATPERIVLPRDNGRRGHPTIFPWRIAADVQKLPAGVGVNHLLKLHSQLLCELDVDDPTIVDDLDTIGDYRKALQDRRFDSESV